MRITDIVLAFASRWFDPAIVSSVFEPLIADWQREWNDAAPARRQRIWLSGVAAFVCAVVASSPRIVLTTAPSAVTNQVASRIARFTLIVSGLLLIPITMQPPWAEKPMPVFIIPSILAAVFPFAMIEAVDALRRTQPLPLHVERAVVVKLGALALVLTIFTGGWVVPAGSHAWRVATDSERTGVPLKGVQQLTTYELVAHPSRAAALEPYTGGADRAARVRGELNSRAVATVMPVLLLWMRWRALDRSRVRSTSVLSPTAIAVAAMIAFTVLTFSGWRLEMEWRLPRGIGRWLPVAMFGAWALLSQRRIVHRTA